MEGIERCSNYKGASWRVCVFVGGARANACMGRGCRWLGKNRLREIADGGDVEGLVRKISRVRTPARVAWED